MPSHVARELLKKKPGMHVIIAIGKGHGQHDGGMHGMHDGGDDGGDEHGMSHGASPEEERQEAYEKVTEGLQALSSEFPEAKKLLAQVEKMWAKGVGKQAAKSKSEAPPSPMDEEEAGPPPDEGDDSGEEGDVSGQEQEEDA